MNANIDKIINDIVSTYVSKPSDLDNVTLDLARKIIHKVEEKAKEMGVKAVVAVADRGGRTIAVECMDDSYIASYDIAVNKAYTCVSLKMSTKKLSTLAQPGQSLYGIQFTNNGKIVIFGGGEPLCVNGKVIGAVGVSGGSEEQDTLLGAYAKDVFNNLI
ncbi:MAG: heme-binding protein [Ruminococcaceae bacterium]|nr:heme-binding protein [Oscillospiraceae bacterium]